MEQIEATIELDFAPVKPLGTKGTLIARCGDQILHSDLVDIVRADHRDRFVKQLVAQNGGLEPEAIRQEILKLVDRQSQAPQTQVPGETPELDVSMIIRPERFITPEVSGIAIPTVVVEDGQPTGRWAWYLRWADGRRERTAPAPYLALPGGTRLWVSSSPTAPSTSTRCGWSDHSRRRWLNGELGPDPAAVMRDLLAVIFHYLELPREAEAGTAATLALWVMLSYAYPAWDAVPYLYFGGPLGSGKSRAFEVLERLVFRPMTSSSLTGPALFRTLHDRGGVVLLDEAERLKEGSPEASELRSALLAGYKRGGKAIRLEPVNDAYRTCELDVYGPKALACINGLPPALASRCINITMFRAAASSPKPRRRIDANPERWQSLRDDLHVLALEHGPTFLELSRRSDICPAMSGRQYELWQPLLALAAWLESVGAEGLLGLMQSHAARVNEEAREDQVPDGDELLLKTLAEMVLDRPGFRPTPTEILQTAQEGEPEMLGRWSAKGVANALKRYGLTTSKSNGQRIYSGVSVGDLRRIEEVYGVDLGVAERLSKSAGETLPEDVPYVP